MSHFRLVLAWRRTRLQFAESFVDQLQAGEKLVVGAALTARMMSLLLLVVATCEHAQALQQPLAEQPAVIGQPPLL